MFSPGDHVLFLGEGNFSFSLGLCKDIGEDACSRITSTCFEKHAVSELATVNSRCLEALGVQVLFGVDATDLQNSRIQGTPYDKAIFMFPHVGGKMNIKKNRQLLRNIATSLEQMRPGPPLELYLGLCAGQGGSELDSVRRREADHWQAAKMMAFGGYQLVEVTPLDLDSLVNYKSFGYRSLNKAFHTENSRLHKFLYRPCEIINERLEVLLQEGNYFHRKCARLKANLSRLKDRLKLSDFECEEPKLIHDVSYEELGVKRGHALPVMDLDPAPSIFTSDPARVKLCFHVDTCPHWLPVEKVAGSLCVCDVTQRLIDDERDWSIWAMQSAGVSPPRYSHDISLWLEEEYCSRFTDDDLKKFLWTLGGDFIVNFSWVDRSFTRNGRRSFTFRLEYQTTEFAMSPDTAWKIHNEIIGAGLTDAFGAEIRA